MSSKRLFEGGETVTTFTGQAGIVISEKTFAAIRNRLKEGKRPGHYFAPGCCHHPDYVIQIPVLFEDGTYDVMRAINIKRAPHLPDKKRSVLEGILNGQTGKLGTQVEG
ncbi:MAG: hypothetical protein JRL30_03010 [Deltaproteobacteria bacterium]|nr:hypothetical protein [Deltaproteobacteria bacterium]